MPHPSSIEPSGPPCAAAPDPAFPDTPFVVREDTPGWGKPSPPEAEAAKPESGRETPPLLIPEWVAWSDAVPADTGRVEAQLRRSLERLRLAAPAVERKIGEGLRFLRDGRFDPVAIGSLDAAHFAERRLGLERGRSRELMTLADVLDRFPLLASSYDLGLAPKSHVLEVHNLLTDENVAFWTRLVCNSSFSQVRARAKEARKARGWDASDEEETALVRVRASQADWDYLKNEGREIVEKAAGSKGVPLAEVVEYLVEEWKNCPAHAVPEILETPRFGLDLESLLAMGGEVVDGPALGVEAAAEARDDDAPEEDREPVEPDVETERIRSLARSLDPAAAGSPEELQEILLRLMRLGQSICWQKGRVLRRCRMAGVGFDADEVLGVSERESRYLRELDGELRFRTRLREAYITGELGWMKVRCLVKIVRPRTSLRQGFGGRAVESWIRFARDATYRLLERTVDALLRLWSWNAVVYRRKTRGGFPPSQVLLYELGVLPGCKRPPEETILEAANVRTADGEKDGPLGALLGAGRGKIFRIRLPVLVAASFEAVLLGIMKEKKTVDQGKCLRLLVDYTIGEYLKEHEALGSKHQRAVAERDDNLCQYPDCTSRVGESDHMKPDARGGSDDPTNRQFTCPRHHRGGKHQGRYAVYGTAPHEVYWVIGRPGHPQEIWHHDLRIGVVPPEERITSEEDLWAWLGHRPTE